MCFAMFNQYIRCLRLFITASDAWAASFFLCTVYILAIQIQTTAKLGQEKKQVQVNATEPGMIVSK